MEIPKSFIAVIRNLNTFYTNKIRTYPSRRIGMAYLPVFLLLVLAIIVSFTNFTFSQTQNGMITGKVTVNDEVTPVPGAVVELLSSGVIQSSTTTSADGTYQLNDIFRRTNSVQVSFPGYPTVRRNGIVVEFGQDTTYNVYLESYTILTAPKVTPETVTGKDVTISTGVWINYTYSNYVKCIFREGNFLWFGCENGGLVKWDLSNNTYVKYTTADGLTGTNITSITADKEGNLWFGTHGGVTKYDGTKWIKYTTADGLVSNIVKDIKIDSNGIIWFATNNGISAFDGIHWINYDTNNSGLAVDNIWSIAIEKDDTKWFGTWGGGVSKFDGTNWIRYNTKHGLADNTVHTIAIDKDGTKWFGTNKGVSKFDGTKWITYNETNSGLRNYIINSIVVDSSRAKWIATQIGVCKFDGTTWTNYTPENGLTEYDIMSIHIDSYGTKWFGTYGKGLSKFDGTAWTSYTTEIKFANTEIGSILIDYDNIKWFGTLSGVTKFDGTSWTTYDTNKISGVVYPKTEDKLGTKWFGTLGGGVSKFDGINWTTYTTKNGLTHNSVTSIAIDKNGNKWFGTEGGGVSKYDDTYWTNYTTENGLTHNSVLSIAIDKNGNKWFGTYGGGVSRFNETNRSSPFDLIRLFATIINKTDYNLWTTYTTTTTPGLVSDYIFSIAVDRDNSIWFGTTEGISMYYLNKWTKYTTVQGFVLNDVRSIAIDQEGTKWFATLFGVSKFDGIKWTNYTTKDGLVCNAVNSVAIDLDNTKWFGTSYGISKFSDGVSTAPVQLVGTITGKITNALGDSSINKNKTKLDSMDIAFHPIGDARYNHQIGLFYPEKKLILDNPKNRTKLINLKLKQATFIPERFIFYLLVKETNRSYLSTDATHCRIARLSPTELRYSWEDLPKGWDSGSTPDIQFTVTFRGTPVENCPVELLQSDKLISRTRTLPDGSFEFINVSTGTYQIRTHKKGYETQTIDATVFAGRSTATNLTLTHSNR